jgi:diguanylate cyclase (GGDEF)-like protein/PAS domain S-box-containing protein
MATPDTIKVLLVEDDEEDYLITRDMLSGHERVRFAVDWRSSYASGLLAIGEQRHDVYLIDYRLGPRTGLELVRQGFAGRRRAPVIILTGETDYEIDLEATTLGVTDFLVKQELDQSGLERSLRYAISHHTTLNELARSEERFSLAVRAANDGIWDWDLSTQQVYFSPRWHAILGYPDRSGEQHTPAAWFDLVHREDLARLRADIDAHLQGGTPHLESEHRMRHTNGTWRWVLTRGLAIRNPDGKVTRMAGSISDVHDRRVAQRQLQHDALHDGLTGLPNRALFMDRVDQVLHRSARDPDIGCAVLFLDIDRFKLVNDSLSHAVGDQLLVTLAGRVASALRPGDTVARIGGDEFTVLLDGVTDEAAATLVSERIQHELSGAFMAGNHELFLTASIGISLSAPGKTPAELVRDADIAMYAAKRRTRGSYAVFDESMHRRVVDRLARENELRQAVEQSQLRVHYQPIVDLGSGRIRGLEALARWPAGRPQVSPLEFITIAEETGMISALGNHVLHTAFKTLSEWRRSGAVPEDLCMSVNVSARQLEDPRLPRSIQAAIRHAALAPESVWLEITESTLMQDPERMQGIISEVCATGAGLHLDDFGTGYSSLAALHRFPVQTLKIDQSFVASITGVEDGSDTIVRSMVALAHSLGLDVIAEGIETPAQLRRLRALGCEYGQGFLFSRPLTAEDIPSLFADWAPVEILDAEPHVIAAP